MIRLFTVGLISIAIEVLAGSKSSTLEQFVYPWPGRNDWPSLKISYNYILSGQMTGTEIVKDGTYSYSKAKGHVEHKVE